MAQSGFDRRRLNGPEESWAPFFDETDSEGSSCINSRRLRIGRSAIDIRPIFLQPGLINQANGSAYIETEKTKIACAVYGPRQSKNVSFSDKGRLNVEVKFAPFSCRRRRAPMRDAEDRSIAVGIHQAVAPAVRLELLPKSTVDVFITVIEADGLEGCLSAGSIAASAALVDAGIEILGLVISCSAASINSEMWLDPTEAEVKLSEGTLVLSCIPALDTVTSVWQSGSIKPRNIVSALNVCQKRCSDIHTIVAQSLVDNVQNQTE
ncbi:ribosomal protein S5 domain 2-type protein [Cyathus striatus]|nr:ribosomal protein S5 domain 2-type protein [Cyathus striatus]